MANLETSGLLLVDDETNILKSLTRLFRRHGYNTFTAQNGHLALDILEKHDIGVIVSDMKMPEMSGAEFLKKVARRWPETVRISLTGHADLQDTIDVINDAGIFHYVGKPWDDGKLLNVVHDAFILYADQLQQLARQESTSRLNVALKSHNSTLKKEIETTSVKLEKTTDQLESAHEGEKKLRLEREEAEQLSHAKSRFLATMSHEMRSPLNAVIAMNSLLLETDLNEAQYELAKLAFNGGQSLLTLINDILDFSKIEAGMLQLNQDWFDLIDLVQSVNELMASQAINKPVEIVHVFSPGTPREVYGDETRLKQVLINLVSNAVKFTQKGGVYVKVSSEKNGIKIYIKDTGIGINKEQQNQIFEDFFQADNSDSRLYGGTGLGLSICQKLIKLMNGDIGVSSEKGRGSCFTTIIPMATREALTFNYDCKPKRLVYVDSPNKILFNSIRDQLNTLNCTVTSHYNLPQKDVQFDQTYLIVDMINQDIDSQSYLSTFKIFIEDKQKSFSIEKCKLIALIGSDSLGDIQNLTSKGYPIVLRKPLKLNNLMASIFCDPAAGTNGTNHREFKKISKTSETNDLFSKNTKLLLVEDSPTNQAVLKAILKGRNFLIDIACDGLQAIAQAKSTTYDIILMDLAMPVLDGIAATQEIRNIPGPNQHTTIIAMTANAFPEDRKRCVDAGMNDYVSKPIDVNKFMRILARWLHDKKALKERDSASDGKSTLEIPNQEETLDLKTLEQLAHDTSYAALPNILSIYFEETEKRIPLMLKHYANEDWDALGDEAHTLKSSSGSFGGKLLQDLAKAIEFSVKVRDHEKLETAVKKLKMISVKTVSQLKDHLREISEKS